MAEGDAQRYGQKSTASPLLQSPCFVSRRDVALRATLREADQATASWWGFKPAPAPDNRHETAASMFGVKGGGQNFFERASCWPGRSPKLHISFSCRDDRDLADRYSRERLRREGKRRSRRVAVSIAAATLFVVPSLGVPPKGEIRQVCRPWRARVSGDAMRGTSPWRPALHAAGYIEGPCVVVSARTFARQSTDMPLSPAGALGTARQSRSRIGTRLSRGRRFVASAVNGTSAGAAYAVAAGGLPQRRWRSLMFDGRAGYLRRRVLAGRADRHLRGCWSFRP